MVAARISGQMRSLPQDRLRVTGPAWEMAQEWILLAAQGRVPVDRAKLFEIEATLQSFS